MVGAEPQPPGKVPTFIVPHQGIDLSMHCGGDKPRSNTAPPKWSPLVLLSCSPHLDSVPPPKEALDRKSHPCSPFILSSQFLLASVTPARHSLRGRGEGWDAMGPPPASAAPTAPLAMNELALLMPKPPQPPGPRFPRGGEDHTGISTFGPERSEQNTVCL